MGLTEYVKQQNFKKTAEPAGGKPGTDKLLFVVQKHDASEGNSLYAATLAGDLLSNAFYYSLIGSGKKK